MVQRRDGSEKKWLEKGWFRAEIVQRIYGLERSLCTVNRREGYKYFTYSRIESFDLEEMV